MRPNFVDYRGNVLGGVDPNPVFKPSDLPVDLLHRFCTEGDSPSGVPCSAHRQRGHQGEHYVWVGEPSREVLDLGLPVETSVEHDGNAVSESPSRLLCHDPVGRQVEPNRPSIPFLVGYLIDGNDGRVDRPRKSSRDGRLADPKGTPHDEIVAHLTCRSSKQAYLSGVNERMLIQARTLGPRGIVHLSSREGPDGTPCAGLRRGSPGGPRRTATGRGTPSRSTRSKTARPVEVFSHDANTVYETPIGALWELKINGGAPPKVLPMPRCAILRQRSSRPPPLKPRMRRCEGGERRKGKSRDSNHRPVYKIDEHLGAIMPDHSALPALTHQEEHTRGCLGSSTVGGSLG